MKTRYFTGAALARAGDEMTGPAVVLLAFAVTGTAGMGAVLMACLTVAAAVGGPAFGVLLDRSTRPERALAYALGGYAVGILAVQATVGRVPLGVAAVCALAAGTLAPAVAGGWTSQLPTVVTPAELPRASALDAMSFSAASLAGPALAALVTLWLGARTAVMFSACLVALAVPAALRLTRARRGAHPVTAATPAEAALARANPIAATPAEATPVRANPQARAATMPVRALVREAGAGIAAIGARPALLRATVTSAVSYVGIGMLLVCCPLLGEQRMGGPARGALLLSVLSATSLAANGLFARRRRRRTGGIGPDTRVLISTLVIGASLVLTALAPGWLTMAAVAVDGAGEGPQLTAVFEVRHREAPAHLRGRIFTTAASLKIGGMAVGAALAGPLTAWSLSGCLLVAAGVEALAASAYVVIRSTSTTVSYDADILVS